MAAPDGQLVATSPEDKQWREWGLGVIAKAIWSDRGLSTNKQLENLKQLETIAPDLSEMVIKALINAVKLVGSSPWVKFIPKIKSPNISRSIHT
jgi:hypothetical protein